MEQVITRSRALTAAQRLTVYADAYYSRLLECLGEVYPILKRVLGEEAFDSLGFGYLQSFPSKSYTLNELGRFFAGYLEETRPRDSQGAVDDPASESQLTDEWPALVIDLARLEWAIYEVFDGPGTEGCPLLQTEQLEAVPPEQWAALKLRPAVCLRLLSTRFPVNEFYTAVRRAPEGQQVAVPGPAASFVALTRRDNVVRRHPLSESQFGLLSAILQGRPLAEAIESIASRENQDVDHLAEQLKAWFATWTRNGFFESVYQ